MAQLNDLLVLGKSCFGGAIKANSDHDLLSHSNEFNFISPGYSGDIYINYRTASGSDGNVSSYRFCNGQGTISANIYATTFYGALNGNSTTSSYPLGFSSYSSNAGWGDQTGTTVVTWNDSTGGSVDWRRDNPSTGKISLKVDGRIYINEGVNPVLSSQNANGYWGMCGPDGENNIWIRTTTLGILPYQSGGHGSVGTSSWPFNEGYFKYLNVTNDASNTGSDALAYFRHYNNTDWTVKIDSGSYDYGLNVLNAHTATNAVNVTGGMRLSNTLRIGSTSTTFDGNWCEGIRIGAVDSQWVTIALGTTGETGTNTNCWSIHRTNVGNFSISKNSSDGANGLVMTSTGMGLGTTAPERRLHVAGTSKFTNRIYADEWIQFAGATGLYFPGDGCNGLHILPNQVGSYGPIRIMGTRGGYNGIHFGDNNQGLTVMSCEPHQGLYNESQGRWIIYYKRDVNLISIGNSTTRSNYINMGGNLYVEGNIHINNVGHGGISLYNDSSPNTYGIHMSTTGSYGTFGHVSSDWATYFCFDGDANRGWIFKHAGTNVFSINGSGTLSTRVNIPAINFRPDHDAYYTTASYQTGGNEALVFAAKNAVTSFIFVNGEDGVANTTSDRWYSLTPGLQIKNNCVTIGKLLANNTDPSYKLEVNGTSLFSGKMQVNAPIFGYNYTNNSSAAAFMWDKPSSHYTGMGANGDADTIYFGACLIDGTWETSYKQKWVFNGSVTADTVAGAIWNDYAEYRKQKENIKPGYCVISTDNGEIYKTTEKFQVCDGIVSDTFGFSIGETDECKTPLAVAGRVLAYCYGDKNDYHSGDIVCAGPEGKVYKMTREEIKEYPDRIIGHVSEIPSYEYWGTGNVKVDNRIWIKVK